MMGLLVDSSPAVKAELQRLNVDLVRTGSNATLMAATDNAPEKTRRRQRAGDNAPETTRRRQQAQRWPNRVRAWSHASC
jgi:hypothetical protein